MGRIVLTEFISLDGVVEAPGGEGFRHENWAFAYDRGEEGEQFKVDEALAAEALLLGRVTYEGFAQAWPGYEGELADHYNSMPKYVVSNTLSDPTWQNSHVVSGDLASSVHGVREQVAGEISVAGSIQLAQGLLALDLVDELHLMTFPVVLGTGRKLFGATPDKLDWRLLSTTTYGEGVVVTVLERDRRRTSPGG